MTESPPLELSEGDRSLITHTILSAVEYFQGQGWQIVSAAPILRSAMVRVALESCGLPAPASPVTRERDLVTDLILSILVDLCQSGQLIQPESSGGFRLPQEAQQL